MLVRKSVRQRYEPPGKVAAVMEIFRKMTNECIRIGLEWQRKTGHTPSMKRLCALSYHFVKRFGGYSQYRLNAISMAAGILYARAKSVTRGFPENSPYLSKSVLVSCYGFKIEGKCLEIHLDSSRFVSIQLNDHTLLALSEPTSTVRSFTLTTKSLSLCIARDVKKAESKDLKGVIGIDRNLTNLAVGNWDEVTLYDVNKVVEVGRITRDIMKSFKRNDVRIRKRLFSKYGRRKRERIERILHMVTKEIVERAKLRNQAIVFEDIRGIRTLYRKGNGQSRSYRYKMNSWPFHEVKRQVEYKAAWEGIPVVTLTRSETKGTTVDCPRCGKRSQVPVRSDGKHHRQLWCEGCRRWMDRDIAAVLNISRRGWLRFDHSSTEGEAGEAVKRDAEHEGKPLILRVDASKLRRQAVAQ